LARKSTFQASVALIALGLAVSQSRAVEGSLQTLEPGPAAAAADEQVLAQTPAPLEGATESKDATQSERIDELERRVKALEQAKPRQEESIRSIIRSSLGGIGSKINEFVSLGGSLEVSVSQSSDFSGSNTGAITLDTAELDFEIKANNWVTGSLVLAYESASSTLFPTTAILNTTGTDRLTADKAFLVIGDVQRFPIFARAGLEYLEFGSSTGVHRADVLSLANPLTVEAFETRHPGIGIGFGLPTPALKPPEPAITVPQVRPQVVAPVVESIAHALGYQPPPSRPKPRPQYTPPPEAPSFYGIVNVYDANGVDLPNRSLGSGVNARLGYRTKGHCGRGYSELASSFVCPWSLDVNVDYDSSIFDSTFLQSEYQPFLQKIGTVSGLASTLKVTFGPWSLVGERDGATTAARFVDEAGTKRNIQPAAWQVAIGYQFDWNPWVEAIGEQGDYISIAYSRSHDLAGVSQLSGTTVTRVGSVPRTRLAVTAGEWVLENTRLAIEYSRDSDYQKVQGGTGRLAHQFVASTTYNF
jgi:hypothetical protein